MSEHESNENASKPIDSNQISAIEQFLYREARLLDERRYMEWYALLADDLKYEMPTRDVLFSQRRDEDFAIDKEVGGADDLHYFKDDKLTILGRIMRLTTPEIAWAENPPSRTRHLITNIEPQPTADPDEIKVYSNFMVHRSRNENEEHRLVGQRTDLLRSTGASFVIARRRILLDAHVLLTPNLSMFF